MRVISSAFSHQGVIPTKYTCFGENINPPLQFFEVPSQAKSLLLIVDDPDAPNNAFVHWIIFNMPPNITEIAENTEPEGVEGKTSFGKPGYGAPCPPSGTHRYVFHVYALDALLDLDETADKQTILSVLDGHVIEQAELIGLVTKE